MPRFEGRTRPVARVGIVVSGYHEMVTGRLLDGALRCCREAGMDDDLIDVLRVPGAFELGVATATLLEDARHQCLVALGVVIRGETPHFDYVAGETSRVLAALAVERGVPVGFGLLTVDTLDQAMARAGGSAGNKGYEAAEAALQTADLLRQVRDARSSD